MNGQTADWERPREIENVHLPPLTGINTLAEVFERHLSMFPPWEIACQVAKPPPKKERIFPSVTEYISLTLLEGGDPLPLGLVLVELEAVLVARLAVSAADAVNHAVQVAKA